MNACITREAFVFTVFRRVFHSTSKLELCRHACRRRDPIISTCRYGKNMSTTALIFSILVFGHCVGNVSLFQKLKVALLAKSMIYIPFIMGYVVGLGLQNPELKILFQSGIRLLRY